MKLRSVPWTVGALFVAAHLPWIGEPFLRHREGVCAQYAVMARNSARLGYATTRFGLLETSSPDLSVYEDWRRYFYPNRPAVSVLATSLWFRAFGDGEWVLRLSLLAASLGTLAAFHALARRIMDARGSAVALAAFAFNPMFWYFSAVAVHLVYALGFSLAAWACRVRWGDARRYRWLTFLFLFLACQSDWPGYFAALSIAADAVRERRWGLGGAVLGLAVGSFGLHLLHLVWIDPEDGPLVGRLLRAAADRTVVDMPGPWTFLAGEAREVGLYFTVGGLALAAAGASRLPRRAWLLGLLGLEEVIFLRWSHVHDYLTYSLTPLFALLVASGVRTLGERPGLRAAALALVGLGAAQSAWITGDRLTRRGAYEVNYRAGLAVREVARPDQRVLLTVADLRQYTPYYADRYTAGVEPGDPLQLTVHPSGGGQPVSGLADLERFLDGFDWVLVGDPDAAAREIRFFRGRRPPESFWFLDASHPLRRKLESVALAREERGAFLLYRLR